MKYSTAGRVTDDIYRVILQITFFQTGNTLCSAIHKKGRCVKTALITTRSIEYISMTTMNKTHSSQC